MVLRGRRRLPARKLAPELRRWRGTLRDLHRERDLSPGHLPDAMMKLANWQQLAVAKRWKGAAMTGITRRFAIPLGLAALVPAASQAKGRCKRKRPAVRLGCGVCAPDRNALYGATLEFFADQSTVAVTLTPAAGNPQVLTPEDFAGTLADSMVHGDAPICRKS